MSRTFDERIIRAYDKLIGRGSRVFVVDPSATRNGTGGNGTPDSPFADFEQAYSDLPSGKNAAILLLGGPATGTSTDMSVRLTAAFDWAKPYTHLIGLSAPNHYGQRARITGPSTGGTFSPVFTASAHGCRFENFAIFDDFPATGGVDAIALKVSGQRNFFNNVNVQGMGAAAAGDDTGSCSLWLAGGAENLFRKCVIGLDTIPRSTTNGEILMTSAAKRNRFEECQIKSYCDNAGHLFVKAANSGDLDRENTFWRCLFENCPTGIASGTTMTQAMDVHASAGGMIVLYDCALVGATDWAAADNGNVIAYGPSVTAGTVGLAAAVTR